MAADEREEQAPEATNTVAVDTGRAPPAQRKQQGLSQYLGSFGKGEDAERLVQLRKENLEFRLARERDEERQQRKKEEMVEAYKSRQAENAARVKEERQVRLARLEGQRERSIMKSKELSVALSEKEEEIMDEHYLELLEKYGDRIRVPRITPLAWKNRSVMSSDSSRSGLKTEESQMSTLELRKHKRLRSGGAGNPCVRAGGLFSMKKKQQSHAQSSSASAAAASGTAALPALKTGGAKPNAAVIGTEPAAGVATEASETEIPEPERPLMPRKNKLRQNQLQLLKKTEVSFFKSHMKKHFRKILEATEVPFTDKETRRIHATWNLAKPLKTHELKQLSAVVVRANP